MEIKRLVEVQRQYFNTGKTRSIGFRLQALDILKRTIKNMELEICQALYEDLGKSNTESYMAEVGMTLAEISHMQKYLRIYGAKKYVMTPLAQFPATSFKVAEPYGVVLVMSPWNYPFALTMEPLVDALAAGNTVILKPSAYAPSTSRVIKKLISACFKQAYVAVVQGGREVNSNLLEEKFDYIFFTGGKTVGHVVMEKAAAHLTPMTLELGGKSPCIVDSTADIPLAAKRIVFGKFLNAGQTCVAPDYILVHKSVEKQLLFYLKLAIENQFGTNPLNNSAYGHIINEKHFKRLMGLLKNENIVIGGGSDEKLKIQPTIVSKVTLKSPLMQEEIFGPILPVLTYTTKEEALKIIEANPTPLAFYLFSNSKQTQAYYLKHVRFGGGCINDTIIHLATSAMPFGGTGQSGMGGYHGKTGFDTFSHYKSIVKKSNKLDLPMRYQPYNQFKNIIIRLFLH